MTVSAPVAALLLTALLGGGVLLAGAGTGAVSRPAAVETSPRPTPAVPARPPSPAPLVPALTGRSVRYAWPLRPPTTPLRRFGVGPHPWSPGHRGVDLGADPGAPVVAAADGRVVFSGPVAERPVVVVSHADGVRTTYQPVVGVREVGVDVTRGEVIGSLAPGDGHCPGACLHWGALRGPSYLDPLALLPRPRPPILLPLDPSLFSADGRSAGRGAGSG